MKKQMTAAMVAILMVTGSLSLHAQTSSTSPATPTTKTKKAKTSKAPTSEEKKETKDEAAIRELREKMAAQQAQIDALTQQNAAKDAALSTAQSTAATAQSQAASATAQAQSATAAAQAQADQVNSLKSTVTDLQGANASLAGTISTTKQEINDKIDSPTAIHYKGILIQPGGFVAAETVTRTRAIDSDINTPFSATPYMNSAQAYTSETNFSGRQSRLAVLVTAPLSWGKSGGYYEMDFLGAGTTSNDNQSNSYLLRQREAWAQIATNSGFTLTGGQMWSLVTEVKKGINPAPGAENLPNTIDAQYHVGFSWARQYGLRFAQTLGPKANLAFAIEESQTVLAGTNLPSNFFFGAPGNTSGLYNSTGNGATAQNYTNNTAPDLLIKYTADPGYGHYEIGGVLRFFRDRVYPQASGYTTTVSTTAATGTNYTTPGGGFFVNARFPVTKYVDIGLHVVQGDGVGRYGTSNLGDVTARPNGLLEPLRSSQGLFSLETHPTSKLDIFGYAGGEYLQRTVYTAFTSAAPTTPVLVGYAPVNINDSACGTEIPPTATNGYSPGSSSCSAATRDMIEGTAGFIYRIFSSPTKGRFQYWMTYSYLTKEAWTGINTHDATGYGGPKATNNMIFTSFRYYIP